MSAERVRIGIDVGGTFTHAAAVAARGGALLGCAKVPTTHDDQDGVARGVALALEELLRVAGLSPAEVSRVSYSTTQATNALLEGDVAVVGILSAGRGWQGARARGQADIGRVELAPGVPLRCRHEHLTLEEGRLDEGAARSALKRLREGGAEAVVAAAAFSVDDPSLERRLAELAVEEGLPATPTHEISRLYGLRARVRTAAINAAILPKMLRSARQTETAVRALGVSAPLVVMRSDGGAMSIDEMKKRPILTVLSGPAAGVAAALMAARLSDGLFVEVGGTSTDVSCIRDGRPSIRAAQVGAHRLYLNTLDVRTVGVAGGSMLRLDGGCLEVGPRSAHIAGLPYSAFSPEAARGLRATLIAPRPGDPAAYAVVDADDGPRCAPTPTCAANLLGLLPQGDPARGNIEGPRAAFAALGRRLSLPPEEVARRVLEAGVAPILRAARALIEDNALDRERLRVLGGGGAAGVWAPQVAAKLGVPCSVAENSAVISAIGAAMALLQECVERTLLDPKPSDVAEVRRQAEQAVLRAGAVAESVEVRVEIDAARGILRATATGAHELTIEEDSLEEPALRAKASGLMGVEQEQARLAAKTRRFFVYTAERERKAFWGLLKRRCRPWRVLDHRGDVRLGASHGTLISTRAASLMSELSAALERHAGYSDAGRAFPPTFLVTDDRTVDLSGLASEAHVASVCQTELGRLAAEDPVVLALSLPIP